MFLAGFVGFITGVFLEQYFSKDNEKERKGTFIKAKVDGNSGEFTEKNKDDSKNEGVKKTEKDQMEKENKNNFSPLEPPTLEFKSDDND